MKIVRCIVLWLLIIIARSAVFGQNSDDASAPVKQGELLNSAGKYAGAIDKYLQALKIDSVYLFADYQLAYSLSLSGKGIEGIQYLNKVIKVKNSLAPSAYDLLGSIYNKDHQTEKAVAVYREAIALYPTAKVLYYNLGLIYWSNKQFAEAENCAVDVIKIDPGNANAMRMYALVAFHQNKRAGALLGLCSFILMERQTARSPEAYGNIQHILQGGALKPEPGTAVSHAIEIDTYVLNQAITQAVTAAAKNKYPSPGDELTAQLQDDLRRLAGQLKNKQAMIFSELILPLTFISLPNRQTCPRLHE